MPPNWNSELVFSGLITSTVLPSLRPSHYFLPVASLAQMLLEMPDPCGV
jgi:hypothetical protein